MRSGFLRFWFGKKETFEQVGKRAMEDLQKMMAQASGPAAQAHPAIIPPEQLSGASAEWSKPDDFPTLAEPMSNDATPSQISPPAPDSAQVPTQERNAESTASNRPDTGHSRLRIKKRYAVAIVVFALLTVWLRPWPAQYREYNRFWGGFTDYQIDGPPFTRGQPSFFRVTFEGNAFTSLQVAEDYALLRAASLGCELEQMGFVIRQRDAKARGILGKPRVSFIVHYQAKVTRGEVDNGSVYVTYRVRDNLGERYSGLHWWQNW